MTIDQILKMPIGQKFGGFDLTIKTAKKKWQVNKTWMHQVCLMDETGEMLADVNIGQYIPLHRGTRIHIIVAEVQDNEKGKKLYIDQFDRLTMTVPEYEAQIGSAEDDWDKVNRGKVRHGLICALIRSGQIKEEDIPLGSGAKMKIEALVDYIMTGK